MEGQSSVPAPPRGRDFKLRMFNDLMSNYNPNLYAMKADVMYDILTNHLTGEVLREIVRFNYREELANQLIKNCKKSKGWEAIPAHLWIPKDPTQQFRGACRDREDTSTVAERRSGGGGGEEERKENEDGSVPPAAGAGAPPAAAAGATAAAAESPPAFSVSPSLVVATVHGGLWVPLLRLCSWRR